MKNIDINACNSLPIPRTMVCWIMVCRRKKTQRVDTAALQGRLGIPSLGRTYLARRFSLVAATSVETQCLRVPFRQAFQD